MNEDVWSREDSSAPVMATSAPLPRNAGMKHYGSIALPDRIDPEPAANNPKPFHVHQTGALTPETSPYFRSIDKAPQITVEVTATPLNINTRMARVEAEQDKREPSAADLVRADLQASMSDRSRRSSIPLRQQIQEAGNVYHGGQRASPGRVMGQLARHALSEIFNPQTHDVTLSLSGYRPGHAPQASIAERPTQRFSIGGGPGNVRARFEATF